MFNSFARALFGATTASPRLGRLGAGGPRQAGIFRKRLVSWLAQSLARSFLPASDPGYVALARIAKKEHAVGVKAKGVPVKIRFAKEIEEHGSDLDVQDAKICKNLTKDDKKFKRKFIKGLSDKVYSKLLEIYPDNILTLRLNREFYNNMFNVYVEDRLCVFISKNLNLSRVYSIYELRAMGALNDEEPFFDDVISSIADEMSHWTESMFRQ